MQTPREFAASLVGAVLIHRPQSLVDVFEVLVAQRERALRTQLLNQVRSGEVQVPPSDAERAYQEAMAAATDGRTYGIDG